MNKEILFYDTETTGLPRYGNDTIGQPHLVQLAAVLVDETTREIKQQISLIIKPYGWDIPDFTVDIHGITSAYAVAVGVSESAALNIFIGMWSGNERVAFNNKFDDRVIEIGLMRYSTNDNIEAWLTSKSACAMKMAKEAMNVTRNPKLSAAHDYFIGGGMDKAHDAMSDTIAAKDIYFSIKDQAALSERG